MDVAQLTTKIHQILTQPDVDLAVISAKRVRKQLVVMNEDPQFLRERKDEVDALISKIFLSLASAAQSAPQSSTQTPATQASPSNAQQPSPYKRKRSPSPQHEPPSSQPHPLRKVASNGQSKSALEGTPGYLVSDAELARQLSMELNSRATRGTSANATSSKPKTSKSKSNAAASGKKSTKVKSKATVDSDGEDDGDGRPKKKAKGGFGKEFVLSDPLSSLVGATMLSRPQAVKKLWEHIKANDLQNPQDRREILCDDKMKAIFKTDRVNMFKMNKILGEHLSEPGE